MRNISNEANHMTGDCGVCAVRDGSVGQGRGFDSAAIITCSASQASLAPAYMTPRVVTIYNMIPYYL